MKAAELRNEDKVAFAFTMYGEGGTGVMQIMKDGTHQWVPVNIGHKATAPQSESANQKRLGEKAALDQLIGHAANALFTGANGDAEAAEAKLKEIAPQDPFLQKNALAIIGEIRKGAPKAKTSAQTTEEVLQQLLGGDETPGAKPANGKPAAAAAPKYPKGKADGAKLREYAKARKIDYKAAVAQAEREGYDVTGLR